MQPRISSGHSLFDVAGPAAALLLLVGLTLAAYAPFNHSGFAATDSLPLVESSRLVNLDSVARLFTAPVMGGSAFAVGELVYRPFVSLTFGVDYLLWGLDSAGYHVSNLALHLVAVAAVWLLLHNLGLSRWSSILGAALFALHPVVVATVPVIGRRDSVAPVAAYATAAALVLAAQDARGARRTLLLTLSLLVAAVALLSKESAFVAIAMLPVLLAARAVGRGDGARGLARSVLLSVPFLILAGFAFSLRLMILGGLGGMSDADLGYVDFNRYGILIGAYVRDLLWSFADLAPATREIWLRLAGVILVWLGLTLIWLPRRQALLAGAGALWVITFGLFCAVFKITTMGWLAYFSLVGLALLFAAGLEGAVERLRVGLRCFASRNASWRLRLATVSSAVLTLGLLTFAVTSIWASALFRTYSQWQVAGDVEERYMQALTTCVAGAPDAFKVNLLRVPGSFDDGRSETNMLGVTLVEQYTAQSALRLAFPTRELTVHVQSVDTLRDHMALRFNCARKPDGLEFSASF